MRNPFGFPRQKKQEQNLRAYICAYPHLRPIGGQNTRLVSLFSTPATITWVQLCTAGPWFGANDRAAAQKKGTSTDGTTGRAAAQRKGTGTDAEAGRHTTPIYFTKTKRNVNFSQQSRYPARSRPRGLPHLRKTTRAPVARNRSGRRKRLGSSNLVIDSIQRTRVLSRCHIVLSGVNLYGTIFTRKHKTVRCFTALDTLSARSFRR